MRRLCRFCGISALLALLPFLLTGCWDMKSIQDTNYITAFGLDYKEDRYVVYAQLLDFGSVAKIDGASRGMPATIWVGREEGDTMTEAIDNIIKTSQQRVFFGHVSSVVFTENALNHGLQAYIDGLIRFRETRYTQWAYGTREPLDRLFTTAPFFNLTPLASILDQPKDNYDQLSDIRPIRANRMIATFREPGATLQLPSLAIAKNAWEKNNKPDPKLVVDGIFAIQRGELLSWIDAKQLAGLRWLEKKMFQAPMVLYKDGKPAATVYATDLNSKLTPRISGETVAYSVRLKGSIILNELLQPIDEDFIKRESAKEIQRELEHTLGYGKKKAIDLFSLEHVLYHDDFPAWSRLTGNGNKVLKEYAFDSIDIHLDMLHSGMFNLDQEKRDY